MQKRSSRTQPAKPSAPCRKRALLGAALLALALPTAAASPENFTKLKFTEVVQKVTVIQARSEKPRPATVDSVLTVPDRVATGPDSRAELLSEDGTLTRVGANTVFSFGTEKREVNLQKGSVLFHSPSGKGGGVIRTNGAQASVMGTTLIVTATSGGGFKLLVLEGKAKASLANGSFVEVAAGQLTVLEPGRPNFGPVLNFRLKDQVSGSALLKGFHTPLASEKKVLASIDRQERMLEKGRAELTKFRVRGDKVVEGGDPPPHRIREEVRDTVKMYASSEAIKNALGKGVSAELLGSKSALTLKVMTPKDLNIDFQLLAALSGANGTPNLNAKNISLEARTLVLKDIDFKAGTAVLLSSSDGTLAPNPNSNKPVQNMKVNFVSGVKYGGVLIPSDTTTSTLTPRFPGITLKANGLH